MKGSWAGPKDVMHIDYIQMGCDCKITVGQSYQILLYFYLLGDIIARVAPIMFYLPSVLFYIRVKHLLSSSKIL